MSACVSYSTCRRGGTAPIVLAAWLLTASAGWASEPSSIVLGHKIDPFSLRDHEGKVIRMEDFADQRLLVVAFLGTECPLAKLYVPRLIELATRFKAQGVAFVGVDSNLQDSDQDLQAFVREQGISFPLLKDPDAAVADLFGAERTPEVFVLDQDRTVLYRGRVDDQYGVGYRRPTATRADLAIALEELLAGRRVSEPLCAAVGCRIGRSSQPDKASPVTWSRQISHIFRQHCQTCHRPGDIGPFALVTYGDVVGWAETIREVVEQDRMPPWFADPHHGDFVNDTRLSGAEKEQIVEWVRHGAPEGNPDELTAELAPLESSDGWHIRPDQVFRMSDQPFEVPAEGLLEYQNFVIDPGFREDKWIQAIQCRPGNRSVVHHFAVILLAPGSTEAESYGVPHNFGILTSYAPGTRAMVLPPGYAKFVPAGARLKFVLHYTPNGSPQQDLSEVGVVYADPKQVKHPVAFLAISLFDFAIPPHAAACQLEASIRLDRDYSLLSLVPHMHYRGKSFRFEVEYPDRTTETLLSVPNYDFDWQYIYRLRQPKLLPLGTQVRVVGIYDNSAANPRNPDPTAEVRWGEMSSDEMLDGFIEVAYQPKAVAAVPRIASPRRPFGGLLLGGGVTLAILAMGAWLVRRGRYREPHTEVSADCATTSPSDPAKAPARPQPISRWRTLSRRLPWVIALGAALVTAGLWVFAEFRNPVIPTMKTLVATIALLELWLLVLSGYRWWVRLLGLAAAPMGLAVLLIPLRFDGFTADLAPIFVWRNSDAITPAALPASGPANLVSTRLVELGAGTSEDCPQFLGPQRNGVYSEARLSTDWATKSPQLLWRRSIGAGWSSFAVQGNLATTQEQRGQEEFVVGYDLDRGEPIWTHADPVPRLLPEPYYPLLSGNGPRATPALAAGRCVTLGDTGLLNCFDAPSGRLLWSTNVLIENGAPINDNGYSCSPLVLGNLVIVAAGGPAEKSLVAYDLETGKPVWAGGKDPVCYSSPMLVELHGAPQILIFNRNCLAAHDPDTGRQLWRFPWEHSAANNVMQPVLLPGNRLFISNDTACGVIEVQRQESGFRIAEIWQNGNLRTRFSNVVARGDSLFGLDLGILTCLDQATGTRRWKRGRYGHGHVLLVGDTLLVQGDDGTLALVVPTPDRYQELARFAALDGKTWAMPAVAGRRILLRSDREAACYQLP